MKYLYTNYSLDPELEAKIEAEGLEIYINEEKVQVIEDTSRNFNLANLWKYTNKKED